MTDQLIEGKNPLNSIAEWEKEHVELNYMN